ncbi:uncharacterized protein LOC141853730 isoform X1 [Brevipalpus obovatus]|uniref:uncharacterized protein LOC141853730 isoform X1 n=1 Tax=Brevipalpus obovatus TaxID=246614 RepID=UPI003D9E7DB9
MNSRLLLIFSIALLPILVSAFPSFEKEEEEPKKSYYKDEEDDDDWKDEEDDYFKKKFDRPKWSHEGWRPIYPRPLYPSKKYDYEPIKPQIPSYLGDYEYGKKKKKEPQPEPKKEDLKDKILEDVEKLIPKVYID